MSLERIHFLDGDLLLLGRGGSTDAGGGYFVADGRSIVAGRGSTTARGPLLLGCGGFALLLFLCYHYQFHTDYLALPYTTT